MADTVKSSSELKITWQFEDGDTRNQTIKDPRNDLTAADLNSFATATKNNNVIIGDKTGAAVEGIISAVTTDKTDVTLDLST